MLQTLRGPSESWNNEVYALCTDEIDSYMYQSVGHSAIDLYAEAMGLPLYRRTITGSALVTDMDYDKHSGDEVEDLFFLLQDVQVLLWLTITTRADLGHVWLFARTGLLTWTLKILQ